MNSYAIACISFLCIFGGAMCGFLCQRYFPAHHLTKESHDTVKIGAGLIATMAALILGLLVSSSKGTYDRVNDLVNDAAANIISLDMALRNYGPEADSLRHSLSKRVITIRNDIWPQDSNVQEKGSEAFKKETSIFELIKMITDLNGQDPANLQMKSSALQVAADLNKDRWKIVVESTARLPLPLLVIPVFWITFLTFVYGLFAPRNGTVAMVLFFCSVSIAGAIYLICEMSMPLDGSIKVPINAIQTAIDVINRL